MLNNCGDGSLFDFDFSDRLRKAEETTNGGILTILSKDVNPQIRMVVAQNNHAGQFLIEEMFFSEKEEEVLVEIIKSGMTHILIHQ